MLVYRRVFFLGDGFPFWKNFSHVGNDWKVDSFFFPIRISFGWSLGEYLHEHIFFWRDLIYMMHTTRQLVSCKLVHTNISLEAYVNVQVEPVFMDSCVTFPRRTIRYQISGINLPKVGRCSIWGDIKICCNCLWSWEVVVFFYVPQKPYSFPVFRDLEPVSTPPFWAATLMFTNLHNRSRVWTTSTRPKEMADGVRIVAKNLQFRKLDCGRKRSKTKHVTTKK